jgi:uncharacterized protein (TIGR00661 family)
METIAISLCGEGRGHATRICSLIERLERIYEIRVYSYDDGYKFLHDKFSEGHPTVTVSRIPGISFQYSGGRLDVIRTIKTGLEYQASEVGNLVDQLINELETHNVSLAITDFEPCLPRAAARYRIPLISVDHQHFLLAYELDALPQILQWHAWFIGNAVWMYVSEASETIVSAFFKPKLRSGWEHVVQVGPLLRHEITSKVPRDDGYILSYLRRHTPFSMIQILADCGLPVKVYGLGERESLGQLSFQPIDEHQFVEDLANCHAVISAAGNQLIGEALHLGKPMFVLPERAHGEQSMNSFFLREMACGDFEYLENVTLEQVKSFLGNLDQYRVPLGKVVGQMDGTETVLEIVQRWMNRQEDSRSTSVTDTKKMRPNSL